MSSPARSRRRRALRNAARCADCRSEVRAVTSVAGVEWFEVLHNDACPWFAAQGAQPFRQLKVVRL